MGGFNKRGVSFCHIFVFYSLFLYVHFIILIAGGNPCFLVVWFPSYCAKEFVSKFVHFGWHSVYLVLLLITLEVC